MFLVAGLAVAGLAGIAAAFYFSIRSGNRGDKRLRSAGAGRPDAGRRSGSKSGGTARSDRTDRGRRAAGASHGPDPVPDFGDQVLVGGRRGTPGRSVTPGGGRRADARTAEPAASRRLGDRPTPREDAWPDDARPDDSWAGDSWPGDPTATDPRLTMAEPGGPGTGDSRPGSRSAARLSREAHAAGDATKAAKPRRRVGFRKGTEVDEELWPTETFGGVSDEQFWDDLASDKPLTTTARTAQQDPGTRNRLLDAGPATDLQAAQAPGDDRKRDSVTRDSVTRDDGSRREGRRGAGSGAYPSPRTAPNPATERTAIQPAYAATQAVPSMTQAVPSRTSQLPGAAQPVRVASGTSQPMSAASQPMSAASQPMSAASQPRAAAAQPGETRARRRPSSTEEDPLTSAAFSLRSSGPVDGRSSLRARDTTRDQYDAEGSGPGSAGSYGGTSPYPYPTPSYGDPSVTQTMNTPPYGENYGYGSAGPAPQADEPRRQNGTRSHARPEGTGEETRAGRQAYPREGRQATGSYPAGSYQGNGYQGNGYQGNGYQGNGYQGNGYQGNGYQGNGHRAPYDPRDDYRRLTHQH